MGRSVQMLFGACRSSVRAATFLDVSLSFWEEVPMSKFRHGTITEGILEQLRPMITAKDFSSVGAKPASSKAKAGAAPAAGPGELISALAPTTDDTAEIARLHECLNRNEEFNQALLATVADPIFEVRKDGL